MSERHNERTCPSCSRVIQETGGNYLPIFALLAFAVLAVGAVVGRLR